MKYFNAVACALSTGLLWSSAALANFPLWDIKAAIAVLPSATVAVGSTVTINCPWQGGQVSRQGGNHAAVYTGMGTVWHSYQGRRKSIYVTALPGNTASSFEGKPFSVYHVIEGEGQHRFECQVDFGALKESDYRNNLAAQDVQTGGVSAPPQIGRTVAPAGRTSLPGGRTSPQPSATAPVAAGLPSLLSGSISGEVHFDQFCLPGTVDFEVRINGALPKPGTYTIKTYTIKEVTPTPFGAIAIGAERSYYRYTLKDLPPGNYIVSALVKGYFNCPKADWSPATREVTLTHTAMNVISQPLTHKTRIEERRINGTILTAAIEGAAKGTTARLHNYGPRDGNSWYAKNKSIITLGAGLGGVTLNFGFGEAKKDPWRYYVRDVNLASIKADLTATQLRLRLTFEEEGDEIKGHCASDNYAAKLLCLPGDDDAAPDVDMTDIVMDLRFTPGTDHQGHLVILVAEGSFRANLQAQGVCELIDICDMFTNYKKSLPQSVNKALQGLVNSPLVKSSVAKALSSALVKLKIGYVLEVKIDNGDLVVRHIPQ